ncbi:putative membrane protein [Mycolicibacterium hassiacum DSM 44199]|uniref:Putative membrane protein n=1 Tax=Mycolicibacterium hassiacum (strain DSM 44199 / CIP 105218 / JCM 12690 / 3849) TaxID=1122247 RepID=K5B8D4_MYCHD|nr:hypothetical protein [Mycolicibacterium hassiacum]EKF23503.1 putative membrane protein [Mycolicibacterium hassiacum DSM 44199]MBX5489340.1 hypothetical protein [Mycolicibacterium hassiacum]MDA4084676.1 membrane protein [Mycolicibacterium hassiacum DSM 44199]PZN24954.1 MAG: hypothetical protein DIU75_01690 [Mycolicibacterium hassiacum]VCT89897.1 hypothetical protein MHAS_01597 [Mycolicibacterium hassiacum DSM 44199]
MRPDRAAAESWFLYHGVPAVLPRRARWRRLWSRSAPALAGYAVFAVAGTVISLAAGGGRVEIDDDPTLTEWLIIATLVTAVPLALLAGWLVSRTLGPRTRRAAASTAVVVMVATDLAAPSPDGRIADLLTTAAGVVAVLVLTGLGIGSVLGWALRLAATHLAAVRHLLVRALPVLLLTFLVFFNGPVWLMAANISRDRLWLALAFLGTIAAAFAVSGMLDRVRPMVAAGRPDADVDRLRDTPFETMPDPGPAETVPLRRSERLNVLFVLVTTQLTQILAVSLVTGGLFFGLGLILLSPEVLTAWTHSDAREGTIAGITLPVPQALIHVSMFLAALTFMYISARAVGDGEYRTDFLDPLVDDLRLTLLARNRYRRYVTQSGDG